MSRPKPMHLVVLRQTIPPRTSRRRPPVDVVAYAAPTSDRLPTETLCEETSDSRLRAVLREWIRTAVDADRPTTSFRTISRTPKASLRRIRRILLACLRETLAATARLDRLAHRAFPAPRRATGKAAA